jgi:hypothetical protein
VRSIAAPQHQVLEEAQGATGKLLKLAADVEIAGRMLSIRGAGTGPIDAFVEGIAQATGESVRVLDYHEHAIGSGADAQAVAYLELRVGQRTLFGVGMDANIVSASLKAIVSGLCSAHSARRLSRRDKTQGNIMADQLIIFDTTLRDGEQSPGASMTKDEKLRIARQLERLKVDVIEAGFAASSNGDFEAVQAIANTVQATRPSARCRAPTTVTSRAPPRRSRAPSAPASTPSSPRRRCTWKRSCA